MLTSKTNILAQKSNLKERKLRLRWLLALSSLPLFGIYAAFAIAPQTMTQDVEIATVIEEIALPQALPEEIAAIDAPEDFLVESYWQIDQVRRDDTLTSLLTRLNISN